MMKFICIIAFLLQLVKARWQDKTFLGISVQSYLISIGCFLVPVIAFLSYYFYLKWKFRIDPVPISLVPVAIQEPENLPAED
jgi:hypothetical protein